MASRDTLDLISKLVAFDTTSRESNLPLLEFVQDYLARFGIECLLVYTDDRRKANLYATIGPTQEGGILLSGHTDVVPVDGQEWTTNPFRVVSKNGHLYGRGTADMKSFIAVVLANTSELVRRRLRIPIHLSFSHDEEVGCVGVRSLIQVLKEMPNKPRMCIVGEPTNMSVVIAHKGKYYMRVTVRGREGHSSLSPRGVNAIEFAAELITYMRKINSRLAEAGPFDVKFDIPHSTIMTGIINGGTALNIVPNRCWFDFEIRHLPQENPDALLGEIQQYAKIYLETEMHRHANSTGIEFETVSILPSLDTGVEQDVVILAKSLTDQTNHVKVAFGTEAALFQHHAGIPTVVCGPGSIEQAHKPDEFISLEQVARCETFMHRLIDHVCIAD
jgi:acetylornithine deacetylase